MTENLIQTGGFDGHFRTTRWSMISEVRDIRLPAAQSVLNALLADYWKPIYCHIRKKGVSADKAKDLTQEFFCSVLYEKDLFGRARQSRGKFRNLLLRSLEHFLIDQNRYETAKKRSLCHEITDIDLLDTLDVPETYLSMSDQESFDYAWVAFLIENVSEQVKQHFCSKSKALYWTVFDRRVKMPVIEGTDPPSLSELCEQYGISDPVTASNMISTVKRAFRKTLRTHIREYVYTDADVDEELSELLTFLQKKRRMATENTY